MELGVFSGHLDLFWAPVTCKSLARRAALADPKLYPLNWLRRASTFLASSSCQVSSGPLLRIFPSKGSENRGPRKYPEEARKSEAQPVFISICRERRFHFVRLFHATVAQKRQKPRTQKRPRRGLFLTIYLFSSLLGCQNFFWAGPLLALSGPRAYSVLFLSLFWAPGLFRPFFGPLTFFWIVKPT